MVRSERLLIRSRSSDRRLAWFAVAFAGGAVVVLAVVALGWVHVAFVEGGGRTGAGAAVPISKSAGLQRGAALVGLYSVLACSLLRYSVRVSGRSVQFCNGFRTRRTTVDSLEVKKRGRSEWVLATVGPSRQRPLLATSRRSQSEVEALLELVTEAARLEDVAANSTTIADGPRCGERPADFER
jgi:hypothetical protein